MQHPQTPQAEVVRHIDFIVAGSTHYPRQDLSVVQSPEGVRLYPSGYNRSFHPEQFGQTYPTIEALLEAIHPGRVTSWEDHKEMSSRQESAAIKAALRARGYGARVFHYLGGLVVEVGRHLTDAERKEIYQTIQQATGKSVGVHVFEHFQGKLKAGYRRGH